MSHTVGYLGYTKQKVLPLYENNYIVLVTYAEMHAGIHNDIGIVKYATRSIMQFLKHIQPFIKTDVVLSIIYTIRFCREM